jgi:hypothetical protein
MMARVSSVALKPDPCANFYAGASSFAESRHPLFMMLRGSGRRQESRDQQACCDENEAQPIHGVSINPGAIG